MDWKAVISDKTKFPDDASFTLNGETVSFGELRKQNAASHGDLEKQLNTRQQELDTRDATQKRAVDTLARVLENVSSATGLTYEQLVKGEIPAHLRSTVANVTRETKTTEGIALKDDPLYKPLIESVIAPMHHDVGLLKTALGTAINAYKNDHTRLEWMNFLMGPEKPEGFSAKYEDALQLAVNKGYKDEFGFADVARAARDLAGPIVAKADSTKVRKEGYDEGYKQAQKEMLSNMGQPQPGTGGISFEGAPQAGGKPARVLTIREKLDEAFNDPNIAGTIFGTVQ